MRTSTSRYLDHEGKICQSWGINSTSCTRTHDERDLRDNSRRQHVPLKKQTHYPFNSIQQKPKVKYVTLTTVCSDTNQEDICVSCQGLHPFLDSSSSRVVQSNDRRSDRHGLVHYLRTGPEPEYKGGNYPKCLLQYTHSLLYLTDLLCMSSRQAATKHCKVLRRKRVSMNCEPTSRTSDFPQYKSIYLYLTKHVDQSAVDPASSRHNTVTRELRVIKVLQKKKKATVTVDFFFENLECLHYLVPVLFHAKVGTAMLHKHICLHK